MPRSPYEQNKNTGNSRGIGPAKKKQGFRKRADDAPTWDSCPPNVVHNIVSLATTQGASPTFGYTRDGTSLTLAIYHDGDRMIDYLSGAGELVEYFDWLALEYFKLSPQEYQEYVPGPRILA